MPCVAWSGFLGREQVGQINDFLHIIYRCGFSCELIQLETRCACLSVVGFNSAAAQSFIIITSAIDLPLLLCCLRRNVTGFLS